MRLGFCDGSMTPWAEQPRILFKIVPILRNVIFHTILLVVFCGTTVNCAAVSEELKLDTVDSALDTGMVAPIGAPIPGFIETTQVTTIRTLKMDSQPQGSVGATINFDNKHQESESNAYLSANPIFLHKVIPVILDSTINSTLVRVGQEVKARLRENLYYGSRLVASANSVLTGHVTFIRNGRTLACALIGTEDRLNSSAAIEIKFDILSTDQSSLLPLTGRPVHQEAIRLGADGFLYGITVDSQGKIVQGGRTLSKDQRTAYNTLRVGTNLPLPASILLNLTAAPIIMGAVGAASPEIAFNKPLDSTVKHKRIKGMVYGVITNLPGAFFVQSVIEKGNEIVLSKGDELMIDITVNEPIRRLTLPAAHIESLSVKAELLNPLTKKNAIARVKSCPLPLKPYISLPELSESTSTPAALSSTINSTTN